MLIILKVTHVIGSVINQNSLAVYYSPKDKSINQRFNNIKKYVNKWASATITYSAS
jgi:lantibiotic modifying enzyme